MADRMYSHVLVPTDFKPDRRAAYRVALALASGTGATVTLLHVAPMPERESEGDYQGLDAIRLMHHAADGWRGWWPTPEAIAAENAELENRLRVEVASHQSGAVRVQSVLRRGHLDAELVRFVREGDVDLLVVTDSPSGFLPRLGRSLADRMARELSVEVVRVSGAVATAHRERTHA